MLGFDRRAARVTWTAACVLLLLSVVYLIRKTLFVFIVALLFSYLLTPLVDLLDRILPTSRTRTPALAIAYVIVIGILVTLGVVLGSRIVEQANSLIAKAPEFIERAKQPSPAPGSEPLKSMKDQILSNVQYQIQRHANDIVSFLPKAGLKVLSYASDLIFVVVVPILSFFFLKDGRQIRTEILDSLDEGPRRDLLEDLAADIDLLLIQYMRALLILCTATFVFFSIFLSVIGVPYSILLAAIAFPLEFIPLVGPLTAAVAILLVAALSGYPHVLWIAIFLGIYRIFQDYVLSPRLMSAGMELHPLWVIFGVFAGGEIAGVPGTFLSVPVLAMLRVLYRRMQKARRNSRRAPVPKQSL
jgi:predicted PurR-regulated permease PerM